MQDDAAVMVGWKVAADGKRTPDRRVFTAAMRHEVARSASNASALSPMPPDAFLHHVVHRLDVGIRPDSEAFTRRFGPRSFSNCGSRKTYRVPSERPGRESQSLAARHRRYRIG